MMQPIDNKKEKSRVASKHLPRDFATRESNPLLTRQAVAARIKQARHSMALTQKEAAEKAYKMPLPSYKSCEEAKNMPGGEAIQGLMQLGINANWLLTGEGPMRMVDITTGGIATADRVYVSIPKFFIKGKDGQEREIASEIAGMVLDRQWLEQSGLQPADLAFIRMPDDSMEPTIREGNLIATDGDSSLRGDGVYCLLLTNGNVAVKRLQADFGGGLWVRGDNPAYKEQYVAQEKIEHLHIIGKVIWAGGQL